jgi:hypothetical protein
MKSFSDYLLESLNNIKLDSEQLFALYVDKIDIKTFAINNKIKEEDAKFVYDTLRKDYIRIVSTDQMLAKYKKDDVIGIVEDIDSYVDLGVRYGSEMGASEEEKKQRKEAEKAIAKEKGEEYVDKSEGIDDSAFVNQVNLDFVGIDKDRIQEYFWKKSGVVGYLYFIVELTPEVKEIIKRL